MTPPKKKLGRRPIGDAPKVTVSLSFDRRAAEILERQPNRSAFVEALILRTERKSR